MKKRWVRVIQWVAPQTDDPMDTHRIYAMDEDEHVYMFDRIAPVVTPEMKKREKEGTLTPNDRFFMKKAVGWQPGWALLSRPRSDILAALHDPKAFGARRLPVDFDPIADDPDSVPVETAAEAEAKVEEFIPLAANE